MLSGLPNDASLHFLSFLSSRELARLQLLDKNFKSLTTQLEKEILDLYLTASLYCFALKNTLVDKNWLWLKLRYLNSAASESKEALAKAFKEILDVHEKAIDLNNIQKALSDHMEGKKGNIGKYLISPDDVTQFAHQIFKSWSICKTPLSLRQSLNKPGIKNNSEAQKAIFIFACQYHNFENIQIILESKCDISDAVKAEALFSILENCLLSMTGKRGIILEEKAKTFIKLLSSDAVLNNKYISDSRGNKISIREWCVRYKSNLEYKFVWVTSTLDLVINFSPLEEKTVKRFKS